MQHSQLIIAKILKQKYDTCCSQAVPHPSTEQAQLRLTWQIWRDVVLSQWYGRTWTIIQQIRFLSVSITVLRCSCSAICLHGVQFTHTYHEATENWEHEKYAAECIQKYCYHSNTLLHFKLCVLGWFSEITIFLKNSKASITHSEFEPIYEMKTYLLSCASTCMFTEAASTFASESSVRFNLGTYST